MTGFRVRTLAPHEWLLYRDVRLRALAESPNAFARTLEDERRQPDAYWSERLAGGTAIDLPLLAEAASEAVGLAWARVEPGPPPSVGLYQVWVAPDHRSQGIGARLLEEAIGWARTTRAESMSLFVTCGDSSAMRLYRRAGFEPTGETRRLRDGSELVMERMRLRL